MGSVSIELVESGSGNRVSAWLHDEISLEHLDAQRLQWTRAFDDFKQRLLAGELNRKDMPEDAHWRWGRKVLERRGKLGFESYCIESRGQIEGMLILSFLATCRLPVQAGKDLVYLEYLATAPWNRHVGDQRPRLNRVGSSLFRVALQVSLHNGLKGRIGLHSLSQAEDFYRDKIGMTDMGPDRSPFSQGLHYFELSEERAQELKI